MITHSVRESVHVFPRAAIGQPKNRSMEIIMSLSRPTLFASILVVGLGLLSGASPAAAYNLNFLNQMNPAYKNCVANVSAQLQPQYRNNGKIHDSIIDHCNRTHPAYGRG
jgi:hypothetical protein